MKLATKMAMCKNRMQMAKKMMMKLSLSTMKKKILTRKIYLKTAVSRITIAVKLAVTMKVKFCQST
jgi:hypothetical protein